MSKKNISGLEPFDDNLTIKASRERPTRMTDAFICRPSALRGAPSA